MLFDFLDVVMLLDGVDADSGSVAHFRSGEGSCGPAGDAACDRSGGGWDAFGLELIVLLRVSRFDLGFGLGVGNLRGCCCGEKNSKDCNCGCDSDKGSDLHSDLRRPLVSRMPDGGVAMVCS